MTETIMDHFYRIAETTVPIVLFFWANRMAAKKSQDEKHEQNSKKLEGQDKKLDEILREREMFESHDHGKQTTGPLLAENIRRSIWNRE